MSPRIWLKRSWSKCVEDCLSSLATAWHRVFYAAILPLVAFYALFATFLYPAAAYLHPHGMYASLAAHVPIGLHGLLKVGPRLLHAGDSYCSVQ